MSRASKQAKREAKRERKAAASAPVPPQPAAQPISFGMSNEAVARSQAKKPLLARDIFAPYKPLPGVVPANAASPTIAMDDMSQSNAFSQWAAMGYWGAEEGQQFLGFPLLSALAQRGEYRLIAETLATETTRNWIEFKSADGEDKGDKIKLLEREMTRLSIKEKTRVAVEHDSYFGRAHWFIDLGLQEGPELATAIGRGTSDISRQKVTQGGLHDIRLVEPIWCYPAQYNANNPLSPDFYKPSSWYSMGTPIHSTRLLTFVSREVPDLLKAAYGFAGLAMSQMVRPYVDNWLDTRQGVTSIVKAFTTFVLQTNMTNILAGGSGDLFYNRVQAFNNMRTNAGVLAIDKEKEDFKNVSAPISGLEGVQAQALEHIASIAQMPLVKFTGISPSGLNASGDTEMRCWEDRILAYQEAVLRPNLTVLIRFVQLSLFGVVDPDIVFDFVPLLELTEQEEANLRKTRADTGEVLIRSKALSTQEERDRIAGDMGGPYNGIDAEAVIQYPMTDLEREQAANTMVTSLTALVGDAIIDPAKALEEIRAKMTLYNFGTTLTLGDVVEAEAAPPPMPEGAGPGGPEGPSGGPPGPPGEPDGPGDPGAKPAAGAGGPAAHAAPQPPATKGIMAAA